MKNVWHAANKIRAFKGSKFRLSITVNLSFWSSDNPYIATSQYHRSIFKICTWHLQHFKQLELKRLWNFDNTCFFHIIVRSQVVLHCLLYKLIYLNRHNCNISNNRPDNNLNMQLCSIFSFPKCSKITTYS